MGKLDRSSSSSPSLPFSCLPSNYIHSFFSLIDACSGPNDWLTDRPTDGHTRAQQTFQIIDRMDNHDNYRITIEKSVSLWRKRVKTRIDWYVSGLAPHPSHVYLCIECHARWQDNDLFPYTHRWKVFREEWRRERKRERRKTFERKFAIVMKKIENNPNKENDVRACLRCQTEQRVD